ncbi:FAD:protein FMN transferase [hydrothermal vent metagenome]|uniref:FAD:protein FMN transferase n=1 Tax=hydrothermal vent metagenome TaxID=652676 RepID=A0A3B1DNY6_9ZZZZ
MLKRKGIAHLLALFLQHFLSLRNLGSDIVWVMLFSLLLIGCRNQQPATSASPPPIFMVGSTMGTKWKATIPVLPPDIADEELFAAIKMKLKEINRMMSTYLPTSEVSTFNKSTSTDWFSISKETALVITEAQRISQLSDGAFDITVAPLVNLWNFGPEIHEQQLPDNVLIAKTIKQVGYKKLAVRLSPPTIRKEIATLQIDLSAIAKGYAVDAIAKLLEERGINSFLIDIGGEVQSKGTKQNGSEWRLGIESPVANQRALYQRIKLTNNAIATSGDYRNFHEVNGKRYSHTIDPRTGQPVDHPLGSASVIAKNCMTADAFATTLMVLGPKEGFRFAKKQNLDVMLIERDGEKLSHQMTTGFEKHLIQKQPAHQKTNSGNSMLIFIITFIVFGLAMVGMAIGYLLKNRCLEGSCGGLSAMKDAQGKPLCESCTHPSLECEELAKKHAATEETPPKSETP